MSKFSENYKYALNCLEISADFKERTSELMKQALAESTAVSPVSSGQRILTTKLLVPIAACAAVCICAAALLKSGMPDSSDISVESTVPDASDTSAILETTAAAAETVLTIQYDLTEADTTDADFSAAYRNFTSEEIDADFPDAGITIHETAAAQDAVETAAQTTFASESIPYEYGHSNAQISEADITDDSNELILIEVPEPAAPDDVFSTAEEDKVSFDGSLSDDESYMNPATGEIPEASEETAFSASVSEPVDISKLLDISPNDGTITPLIAERSSDGTLIMHSAAEIDSKQSGELLEIFASSVKDTTAASQIQPPEEAQCSYIIDIAAEDSLLRIYCMPSKAVIARYDPDNTVICTVNPDKSVYSGFKDMLRRITES